MELCIQNLTKVFQKKKVIDNLSLTLHPGIYSLLGKNGAGKTTLMEMIASNLQPSQGQILYDQTPIQTLKEDYLTLFGYLPQDLGFPLEFTVQSYLEYVAALKGLSKKESTIRITTLLEKVSLVEKRHQKIHKLSGGMKRRLGIAQALLNDPKILVLDEPTSGLDPQERIHFKNLIVQLSKDRIVIISTHIVSDVEAIAHEHALLQDGHLLRMGTKEELLKEIEGKVWQAQLEQPWEESSGQIIWEKTDERGNLIVRYLASQPTLKTATLQKPCLEDLVFWLFEGGKRA
ncbi:MAG: ATP-binding cassette domain-containing protein [Allobaculum sp.]|nr:ATP-binding cassette domain-containing protein [Allobaculum sp.]